MVFIEESSPFMAQQFRLHSGKHAKNYGKSTFLMGKSTISMAIFNSYVYQRVVKYDSLRSDQRSEGATLRVSKQLRVMKM